MVFDYCDWFPPPPNMPPNASPSCSSGPCWVWFPPPVWFDWFPPIIAPVSLVAPVVYSCAEEESTRTCPRANRDNTIAENTISIAFDVIKDDTSSCAIKPFFSIWPYLIRFEHTIAQQDLQIAKALNWRIYSSWDNFFYAYFERRKGNYLHNDRRKESRNRGNNQIAALRFNQSYAHIIIS